MRRHRRQKAFLFSIPFLPHLRRRVAFIDGAEDRVDDERQSGRPARHRRSGGVGGGGGGSCAIAIARRRGSRGSRLQHIFLQHALHQGGRDGGGGVVGGEGERVEREPEEGRPAAFDYPAMSTTSQNEVEHFHDLLQRRQRQHRTMACDRG